MPVNLTFASHSYDDSNLFRYAFAFESAAKLRQRPGRTPSLVTDTISFEDAKRTVGLFPPKLSAKALAIESTDGRELQISGYYESEDGSRPQSLQVYVDGEEVKQHLQVTDGEWDVQTKVLNAWKGQPEERGVPNSELAMIVIVASGMNGRSAGKVLFV